jgi:nicotinate-nucleotide adenylyltransferase
MRRLCFGGSFNPIHHGHLICARAVAEKAGFDRIVLIPSAQPPHKPQTSGIAPAEHRLAMCQLAARQQPGLFEVDDLELSRAGRSFTLDTVGQLKARGWPEVNWLIGGDMLLHLPKWHEPEQLLKAANFIIMGRPGWSIDWEKLPAVYRGLERNVVAAPLIDLSATEVRQRVAEGRSIEYLCPPGVVEYIQAHGLYGGQSGRETRGPG